MDTREDPDFLSGIDDFAVDEDMAKLMREVYVAFQSEVSGAECKADAGKLMDLMSKLNAEAQGNTPVEDLRYHVGATTKAARAASSEKAFLSNDAAPVLRSTRERGKPAFFEAGATRVRGSRLAEKLPRRAASCPPSNASRSPSGPRSDNAARALRRKEAREAYALSLLVLSDKTFVDLSWQQRKVVAVGTYANALSHGCAKMQAASVASMAARVSERHVRRIVKGWSMREGFFHPVNWGANRKVPFLLDDDFVRHKASQWLRVNSGFKKGSLLCCAVLCIF